LLRHLTTDVLLNAQTSDFILILVSHELEEVPRYSFCQVSRLRHHLGLTRADVLHYLGVPPCITAVLIRDEFT
jgi:DNA-binding transcriptional regulator YiaG